MYSKTYDMGKANATYTAETEEECDRMYKEQIAYNTQYQADMESCNEEDDPSFIAMLEEIED